MILVDTNVLLRMAQPSHSMHHIAVSAVDRLATQGQSLGVVPQVLYEYWVVGTRPPQVNGLGMPPSEAATDVAKIIQRFRLLQDKQGMFDVWLRIVARYQVLGKNAHDARLVAAMELHGIKGILSFNASDFRRSTDIDVIDPIAFVAT